MSFHPPRTKTLIGVLVGVVLGAGLSFAVAVYADKGESSIPLQEIQTFSQVFTLIKANYVDPSSDRKLMEGAINGMVESLDPHSAYLDPKQFKEMEIITDGKFGGLGIEVTADHGIIRVVAPIDGTPAAKAGIQPGDLIIKINGKAIQGMGLQEAVDMMRGKPGTPVTLTILRPHQAQPITMTLKRAIIKVQSVRASMILPGYGYIRISQFQDNTGQQTRAAVEQLEKESGGKLKGLIIDLRNNPGGVLGAAVETADTFLTKGLIVYTKGRIADSDMQFKASPPDYLHDAPVVVLINGGTASAAEIVTGALKDDGRALVVGQRSFGKGSVQTVMPLSNGGALKLTTALYYTPAGCSIQGQGIVPNVEIEPANAKIRAMDKDMLKESELHGYLKAPDECGKVKPQYSIALPAAAAANATAPLSSKQEEEEEQEMAKTLSQGPNPAKDFQLREALNILEGKPVPVRANDKVVDAIIPLPKAVGQ